jgi:DNA-directed RNA polymerase subunit omega
LLLKKECKSISKPAASETDFEKLYFLILSHAPVRVNAFTQYALLAKLNFMIFPLQELIEYDDNMYEITSAASRRSYQLSMLKDPEIEENDGKVVSLAARQVFTKEVEFRIEE